jgi:hypothetical protein
VPFAQLMLIIITHQADFLLLLHAVPTASTNHLETVIFEPCALHLDQLVTLEYVLIAMSCSLGKFQLELTFNALIINTTENS